MKLPLRSPLGFGFGTVGFRGSEVRGPRLVRRTKACRSDGATCARHEGAPSRRTDRTSAAPRSPRVRSWTVRRGPSSRSCTWVSMVKFGGGGGSSHPRRWLGAQWAGLSPGSGSPTRAARGALRGRRIRAGAESRLLFDHAAAHGWQPHVARVHGRESKRRAERDVRSQRQSQRVRPATLALVGAHQQCGAANRNRLRATVVAYVVNKAPVWPAHAGDQAADWPRLGEALGGLGHKLAQK